MTTPADTLVQKYPDRVTQLLTPVYDYLKKGTPYTTEPQNLYMQVFYPVARKWPLSKEFPANVQKVNPGIKTVSDYVSKVENPLRSKPILSTAEEAALRNVASRLGVNRDTLYNLINFESGWNPQATNKFTGARGLIQFMPSTAAWMGFKVGGGAVLLLVGLLAWYILSKGKIL